MSGRRARKFLTAAVLVLLTAVLCSCSRLVIRELPLEQRLTKEVTAYLNAMAGNDVLLYELTIDHREYSESDGTMDYDCSVHFAWDEFSEDSTNRVSAHYTLAGDEWILASIQSDIGPEAQDSRVVMNGLYTVTADIPDVVMAAFSGANAVMTDQLLDFNAELQGVTYGFPCHFTDFTMNGWEIAEDSGITALRVLPAQSWISVDMVREDETVTLYIANQTQKAVYVGQGICAGFAVRSGSGSAALPLGITARSSAEDVIAAYGAPDTDETAEGVRKLTYQAAANSRVGFLFAADETRIELFTLQAQAEAVQPAALFDDYAFGFTLDGVYYTLPARLDTFLNDGWEIAGTAESHDVIRWYETKTLTLQKGESTLEAVVQNPSMGDLRLYAASVSRMTLDRTRVAYTLVGMNGYELRMDQAADRILGDLGEPSRIETADGAQVATYAADGGRYLRLTLSDATSIAELQAAETDDTVSEALEAFALKVNLDGNAFTLPAAATEFKDKMWIPANGWLQPIRAGSFVKMSMENRRAEGILAYFVNKSKETRKLQECTIAGLYAGPGDVNLIVGRSLGKGVPIEEAFNIFGIPAHDIQDGNARYLVYGASINRFLCVRCVDDLVDALWIVCFTYQ